MMTQEKEKTKLDDLIILKFIGEVTYNPNIKEILFKIKAFSTCKQNISELNGASKEDLLD